MSVYRLEEMSTPALDALDRERTVMLLTVSPLEEHGPHLPVGVDAFAARHFAETIAERVVAGRPGWSAVLAPTLYLGSFTFDTVGTITVRQRVVRDAVVDYGDSLARAGFRFILVANGHAGPGHLDRARRGVGDRDPPSRRHDGLVHRPPGLGVPARPVHGPRSRPSWAASLTAAERGAFAEDAHGGWWETSLMLLLRPELVDESYRTLPPARYSLAARVVPNYPLKNGGQGYVGHPALADPDVRQGDDRGPDERGHGSSSKACSTAGSSPPTGTRRSSRCRSSARTSGRRPAPPPPSPRSDSASRAGWRRRKSS